MNSSKIFVWSITVALAGFLFGFDTIVISGAEKTLQELWGSSDWFHGWIVVSSALWGTVIGAIFGGLPTDRLGRKKTLLWIGILYSVSAIGSSMCNDPWFFAFFRFIGGIGVGASTIAAPAYISEIAPSNQRGRLGALYQFNIVFGILIAFISNYLLQNVGPNAWRWMIGVEAIPALIYTLLVTTVPKSPRWLITRKNDIEGARKVLSMINPMDKIDGMIQDLLASNLSKAKQSSVWSKKYKRSMSLAFFIAFFNQFSGINALLYYAPRIFESAGLGQETALLNSIGIGLTNLIFTLLGVYLIDRLGRKQLLYIGSVGYIISLSLVACAFAFQWTGILVPILIFLFIAAHAIGQGSVIWVFISEIFPTNVRADGQSFGVSTHWVLAAIIPAMMPWLFGVVGEAPVFAFFAFMMVLQLIWVAWKVPETKGKTLEELEAILVEDD